MWQGYVYVNDVRYSNIFTFAVGIFFVNASQDGVTKKMSLHFFQYLCGGSGFLKQKPKNGFTVDVQTANRSKIRYSEVSACF